MLTNRIVITFEDNSELEVEKGTTLYELSKIRSAQIGVNIVGAEVNNEVVRMDTKLLKSTKVKFLDCDSINGYKIHKYGLKLVLQAALVEVFGKEYNVVFDHSIANGILLTISGPNKFTLVDAKKLKTKMNEIIKNNERIYNMNVDINEAIAYLTKEGFTEKVGLISNLSHNIVTMYKLRDVMNYYYSEMPYSTGCLSRFDIVYLGNNRLVLLFPSPCDSYQMPEYVHYKDVIKCFDESQKWINSIGIPYLDDLNRKVSSCKIEDLIKVTEADFNNRIYELVEDIVKKKARFVLFAGPSSSGKTTTTKKVALQLRSRGFETLVLSTDDFFKERVDSPKCPDGSYDFECLECLDLKLMNKTLKDLISLKSVSLPTFNFVTGEKEYKNKPIKITDKTIVLIEGLHAINDAMTPGLDSSLKYKVYLSPFIPLNIDRHNYISTVDLRLLRRIVRDNRSRAYNVGVTIKYWNKVRDGEKKYIFPYIDNVDKIVNTSLVYEIGVLKTFVEPLLYAVGRDEEEYNEARRLIESLNAFFPIPSDYVPEDSIVREFIGKSSFE